MLRSQRHIITILVLLWLPTFIYAQPLREVFRRVNQSVVVVHTEQKPLLQPSPEITNGEPASQQGVGSGVVISEDGKVLTAAHVVQSVNRIEVEFLGGNRVPARILASAPFADVAVLQLSSLPAKATVAKLGDSDQIEPGDQIFVIGAPYGAGHSLSVGHLSARRSPEKFFENLTALELFQIDVAIFQGNSGGPVFNLDGEVIGLVSSVLSKNGSSHGLGFAVTANVARKLMLEEKNLWLGIEAMLIEGKLAKAFNLPQDAGLLVQSVADASLGARLGLHEGKIAMLLDEQPILAGGDIIVAILGQTISPDPVAFQKIQQQLNQLQPTAIVTMKVLREGKILDLSTRIQ